MRHVYMQPLALHKGTLCMQEQCFLPHFMKSLGTRNMPLFWTAQRNDIYNGTFLMQIFLGQNVSSFVKLFSLNRSTCKQHSWPMAELNIPVCAVSCRRTDLTIERGWIGIWTVQYWYPSTLPEGKKSQAITEQDPSPFRGVHRQGGTITLHFPTYENDPFWELVDRPAREIHHPASLL